MGRLLGNRLRRGGSRSSSSSSSASSDDDSIVAYIPPHLRKIVLPYHGDFCYSPCYHPKLLIQLMAEGFLPMATRGALLPKLHQQRCVVWLGGDGQNKGVSSASSFLHVSKSTRQKMKRFRLSLQQRFHNVVQGCRTQHQDVCWLYDELTRSFATIQQRTIQEQRHDGFQTKVGGARDDGTTVPVRLYSVELYDVEANTLVAGELGYSVGSVYTSLTGFHNRDHAGSVQLAALGCLLQQHGFTMWDLGMEMEYKKKLGAVLMNRTDFVQHIRSVRHSHAHVVLPVMPEPVNCKDVWMQVRGDLFQSDRSAQTQQQQQNPAKNSRAVPQQASGEVVSSDRMLETKGNLLARLS